MPSTLSLQVLYTGKVQGVGFRYTVKQIAAGYEVVGWVRNLADGRVELQATGEEAEMRAFLAAVENGQLARHIKQREQQPVEPAGSSGSGFEIRR